VLSVVAAELTRLALTDLSVVGGTSVVDAATMAALVPYASGTVDRLYGADRYATSAAVSAATFAPGVTKCYVAAGLNPIDAMSAAAATEGAGPVLLTSLALSADVIAELIRLTPVDIIVAGGTGVVSAAVMTALSAYASGTVTRQYGTTRWDTSAAISAATYTPGVDVWIASGDDAGAGTYPDAALAAAAAIYSGAAFLVMPAVGVPASIDTELTRLAPANIHIVGGTSRISAATETALAGYTGGAVTRHAGADRYATSTIVSADIFPSPTTHAFVASAFASSDAACGAAAAGSYGGPVLYVASGTVYGTGGASQFMRPTTLSGDLTNRGDYYTPLNMLLVVGAGGGSITASVGDSSFVITVPGSTTTRIIRLKGDDKVLTVEEDNVESLRLDLIEFTGDSTWPLVAPGTTPYTFTFLGVALLAAP
jgi:putative cell wall-binding protein